MLIISFGITGINFRKGHQFNDPKNGPAVMINMLFFSVLWVNSGYILQAARAAANENYEFFTSVRIARMKAHKRGLAIGESSGLARYSSYKDFYRKKCEEYERLLKEYRILKAGVESLTIKPEGGE